MATVAGSLRNKVLVVDDLTSGDITVTDLVVSGTVTLQGTATTLDSTNTTITDSIIELNSGLTGSNTKDIGFVFERGSTGNNAAFIWDESADRFTVITTTGTASDNTLSGTVANFQAGSFYGNGANLTSLNGSNISSGTVAAARIASLATSKITSGTFADARIPSLAASKITSGTFADARIPSLAASKITSGTFANARISSSSVTQHLSSYLTSSSGLNATNLTSGTVPAARLAHNSFYLGGTTAETGRTVKETGIYNYNVNNNTLGTGTITSYYSVMAWGNGAGGSAQLASNWTSSGNKLYFRSLRDTIDNWWDWKEIYHTGHKPTYSEIGTMAYSNLTGTPTIPTNNNQLTNGASYITASSSAVTNKLPLAGGTMTGNLNAGGGINGLTLSNGISGSNFNITGVNVLTINDPGEGIEFGGGSTAMSLAIVDDATDRILRYSGTGAVFDVQGNITLTGTVDGVDIAARNSVLTSTTTTANAALPKAGGTMTGALEIQNNGDALNLRSTTNAQPVRITFSSDVPDAQIGHIEYTHSDTASYGSGESLVMGGTEATMTILADGKLMYKEGIYSKPSTGTGGGTRKDVNWDTAYTDRNKWDGGSTGLTAATGRASLGLGTAATTASTAYATSAQGTLATNALPKAGGTMTGALVVDVDNVANGALRIEANQTNPTNDFYFAQEIISTLSGSQTFSGDKEQGAIYIDLNSSATGGDTSQEHRVYGIYADVDSTGDADITTAGYFNATATPTTGTTTQVAGVEGFAEDNGGAGATTNIIGVKGTAWSDNSTSDVNLLTGGQFKVGNAADSGTITAARGVQGEIELTTGSGDIYGTSYVFEAQYDNNTGAAPTHTAALYYGNYAGELPTTALGVYITDAVPNSFAGSIRTGLGGVNLTSYGFIGDLNTGMYSPANHEVGFTTNGGQRLKLDSTGAVVTGNIAVSGTVDGVDIAARDAILTSTTTTAGAALPKAGGTMTGGITSTQAGDAITISSSAPQIRFNDTTASADDFWIHVNSNIFYVLGDRDDSGSWESPHPLELHSGTNIGYTFGQRIFNEAYHPNADILTNARTIAGTSFNGSADIDISYNNLTNQPTIPSISGLAPTASPTFTGDLTIPNKIIHAGDTNTYIQFHAADQFRVVTGGTERLEVNNSAVTVGGALNVGILKVDGKTVLDLPSNNPERGPWNPIVSSIRNSGRRLYQDEEFASGTNSIGVYNNAGGNVVTITREAATANSGGAAPNSSGQVLRINHNGGTSSPGHGGFIHTIPSEDNHTFVQIFQAKLRTGTSLVIAENAQGTNNTSYWLTETAGTGKWEWYARVSHCGNTGTFSGGGHVYASGGSGNFNWYLASSTVYDVTEVDTSLILEGSLAQSVTGVKTFEDRIVIGDGTDASSRLEIRPADDGTSDDIQFYNGSTRMGEIGTQDTSWLRINQTTSKNIYTPRYIRADSGFFIDDTTKGIDGAGRLLPASLTGSYTNALTFNTVTINTPVVGSAAKIKFANNDYIRYDDTPNTFHFDADGGSSNANLRMASMVATSDITIGDKVVHNGDTNTYMSFDAADQWKLYCGGQKMIQATEASSGYNYVSFGGTDNSGEIMFNVSGGDGHFDGDIYAFSNTTSSDRKLKKNIQSLEGSLEKVLGLRGVSFEWKKNNKKSIGFIAQEVQEVVPDLVKNNRKEHDGIVTEEHLGVDYGNITALLVEAVKEQQSLINRLEERIKVLENKNGE